MSLQYKLSRVASLDVDSQQGFTPLCPSELPVVDGDKIVGELNAQARFAKYRLGSKDAHPPTGLWIATPEHPALTPVKDVPNVDLYWPRHCQVGTKGFEMIPGLPDPIQYDFFVWKGIEMDLHPYGALYHDQEGRLTTGVREYLRSHRIQAVIVGGLALDFCVKTTVAQLLQAGFDVILNKAATRSVFPGKSYIALNELADVAAKLKGVKFIVVESSSVLGQAIV